MFVPCKDAADVQACCEAGLLWINHGNSYDTRWCVVNPCSISDVLRWYNYGNCLGAWRREEFAVYVED